MTGRLLGRLLKKYGDLNDPEVRSFVGSRASTTGIVINLLLVAGKLAAGLVSGSVSVLADGLNNLMDALGSIITMVGFKLAAKKADAEHPFGHGRYEYLAGLAVAVLVLVIGIELGRTGVVEIIKPSPLSIGPLLLTVLFLSILVKAGMAFFYRRLGVLIDSAALKAVAVDARNDALATGAVLFSTLAFRFFGLALDGWAALGVACFILYNGWGLVKETVSLLVGEAPPPELVDYISEKISAHEQVLGIHDLIIHDYGPGRRYVSAHVEMPSTEDPLITHEIIDSIEQDFLKTDNIHLIIHYDPVEPPEKSKE